MAPRINRNEISFVFTREDGVIALQPFVLLSLFQHGGVYLIGKQSPNSSLCFVLPEDGKIELTSFLCFYGNIFGMTEVLWYCVETPLLPITSASPHRFPIYFSICKGKWNRPGSAVFSMPISFAMWMGLTVGLCHDWPKQSNPGLQSEVLLHCALLSL